MTQAPYFDEEDNIYADRPQVTFKGNTYDMVSWSALASGILLLFMCVTCNMGFYCLPFFPLLLGIFGLLMARQAVNQERTKMWSWIGVGIGAAILLLTLLAIIGSIAFIFIISASYQ